MTIRQTILSVFELAAKEPGSNIMGAKSTVNAGLSSRQNGPRTREIKQADVELS